MTVQELIDALQAIEDKGLPVMLDDWSEGFSASVECGDVKLTLDMVELSQAQKRSRSP